jgi:hypothetical protein
MNSHPAEPDSNPQHPADATAAISLQLKLAAAGWLAKLTFWVGLGLSIEAITGFWILFAPFSIASQLQVIAHTVAGLFLLVPYAIYQWRHYKDWQVQSLSVVKLIGFASMVLTGVCLASGMVIAVESAFGPRLSRSWDQVHLVTGVGAIVLLLLHIVFAYARRRDALLQLDGFARRFRHGWISLAAAIACFCGVLLVASKLLPQTSPNRPLPVGYNLPEYAQKFDEYRGSPFAPTYARTSTGVLVNPALLANSASCGTAGCHEQILAEWEPSAHRFSAMNPPFQAVQKKFAQDRGIPETRYCAGCHDPISLFAGAKDVTNVGLSAPGMQEGSSCVVCHSLSHVDERGNADYVLTPPTKYLGEATHGVTKAVSDFLIRAYPRQHLADYNRSVLRTPQFCGACHKQFIPEALNRYGAIPAQDQYDEWRKSHWSSNDQPEKSLSCRDCHMRLVRESRDPGAGQSGDVRHPSGDGAHRHHGFIATNLFMPAVLKLPHHEEQVRMTEDWIKGRTVIPEIADVWPAGPVASIDLFAPKSAKPGSSLAFQAVVKNRKAGHDFITGPLDFIRAWIHLRVVDAGGAIIAEWGAINPVSRDIQDEAGAAQAPDPARSNGTMLLEAVPVDGAGQAIVRHDLWRKAGGKNLRVIFPGYADKQTYTCQIPPTARGPLTVIADLNFRRYRQEFLNLMVPDMERETGVFQPTVTSDSTTVIVSLVTQEAANPTAKAAIQEP